MALTIKQLSGDASFLLTFEPLDTSDVALSTRPFHMLLDPQVSAAAAAAASDHDLLPGDVDVVLVSSARRDHCHEPTLRRLPARTRMLAAPAAARRIRGWRHFDSAAVVALPRWRDDDDDGARRRDDDHQVLRIPVLSQALGVVGEPGEVTLTCIGRKRRADAAIGITYRPPTAWTRPRTATTTTTAISPVPPPPTRLPTPALSISSSSGHGSTSPVSSAGSPGSPPRVPATPPPSIRRRAAKQPPPPCASSSPGSRDRGVSVVFAPHGISYRALHGYATTHLLGRAVLPLTALLHCFDAPRAWHLGPAGGGSGSGSSSNVAAGGRETAAALGARAWVGVGPRRRRRCRAGEVQRAVRDGFFAQRRGAAAAAAVGGRDHPTEVRALAPGEEVTMTSEGVWEEETLFAEEDGDGGKAGMGLLGLGLDFGRGDEERVALLEDWMNAVW